MLMHLIKSSEKLKIFIGGQEKTADNIEQVRLDLSAEKT